MDPSPRRHLSIMQDLDRPAPAADACMCDFDAIYRAHFHEVRRWVQYLGGLSQDADDLAQRVFEVVARRLAGFDGGHVRAWLFAICRRVVAGYRRQGLVRRLLRRPGTRDEYLSAASTAADDLVHKRCVEQILGRMSEKLRTCLILHEIEGYTAPEIAGLLGLPTATVYSRLRLGQEKFVALSRALDEEVAR